MLFFIYIFNIFFKKYIKNDLFIIKTENKNEQPIYD